MENEQSVRAVASYFDEILSGNQQRIREGVCETHYHLDHHHITEWQSARFLHTCSLSLPASAYLYSRGWFA
jgi:hypothetical protein